ncbi:hypothetical protein MANES_10G142050v8 [Manihot esculenta]|uniref:Uncharacterized protein n=1 Tax=Manihot esculenta TaxID=3983 RepID=A0A2C9V7E6_MANES|nr:hypothetical protein MANES_10G142050v8 [Manihot esculenta]
MSLPLIWRISGTIRSTFGPGWQMIDPEFLQFHHLLLLLKLYMHNIMKKGSEGSITREFR